jgi:hypothetical protein
MAKLLEIIPINHIYLERQLPRHENANAEWHLGHPQIRPHDSSSPHNNLSPPLQRP